MNDFRCLKPLVRAIGIVGLLCSAAFAQRSAEEELKTLRTAEGFDVSLFASEPMITNPAAIEVDTRGRVWVAEIQWYRKRAKTPASDKIKVLEDTDGDGRADKATVFAENLLAPMSICVAGSKVYVATSPDLWVYEDRNGDLKADGPPVRLLTGFGGFNHDHGAHSLVVGPDHKWYMSHGDTGFDVTGKDGSRAAYKWGAVLRGEMDGTKLETVAFNFRNPFEVCVSSFGDAFLSDNDNDGNESVRICWIMDGGDYGWFGGPPPRVPPTTPFGQHWHFRGHVPGFVPATLVTGFGSPTGICFYEGNAFGAKYRNMPFHTDAGPREVRVYPHTPAGFGMKATSEVIVSSQGDDYFRPDDICTAPDGSLYVSDWYDGGVGGHAYNNPDQGRIFLLRPRGKSLQRREGPGPYFNVRSAIEGLKSPNLATQFLARQRLLNEGPRSIGALRTLAANGEPSYRARALWLLDRIGNGGRQTVLDQLQSSDPVFRALAVRILRRHGSQYGDAILKLAADSSPVVRREVLLAIRNLSGEAAESALAKLARGYDGGDRYLLEAINIAAGKNKQKLYERLIKTGPLRVEQFGLAQVLDPKAAAEILTAQLVDPKLDPKLAAQLLEAAGNAQSVDVGRSLLEVLGNDAANPDIRRGALEKLGMNLHDRWSPLRSDPRMLELFQKLLADPKMRPAIVVAIGKGRVRELGGHILAMSQSKENDADLRKQAIVMAVNMQLEDAPKVLRGLLRDPQPEVRQAALAGLVDLQDARTLRDILTGTNFAPEERAKTVDRLMNSTGGALVLLRLINGEGFPESLKKTVINKAAFHPDSNIRVLFEDFLPEAARPKRLGSSIKPEDILALEGNRTRGENIFFRSSAAQCQNCHAVHGDGTNLGPDLSTIGKKYERRTLLETILEPSKAIAPEFVPHLLETDEGKVYAGFLIEKTNDHVTIKDVKGELIRVAADSVEALVPQRKSLMPELVLRDVTAQDAADLLAFLTSLKQTTQPVTRYHVLGPLESRAGALDSPLDPEKSLKDPDLKAQYRGLDGKPVGWRVVSLDDPSMGLAPSSSTNVGSTANMAHYYLLKAESASAQDVDVMVGSPGGYKVWLNGESIHRNPLPRKAGAVQERVEAKFAAGKNVLVIKVISEAPPRLTLALRAAEPLTITAD